MCLGAALAVPKSGWATEATAVRRLRHDRDASPELGGASTTATAIEATGDTAMARRAGATPYYGGRYPYYGVGAGLATGAVIGAAATYPYYNYPYSTYQTPVSSSVGGYCVTAVLTCALTNSAPVGTGCSCRTSGGRARGTVQ